MAKQAVSDEALPPDFGVTMAGFLNADGHAESVGFMDPLFERYGSVNVYRFYFGPYIAYIKADQRPFSDLLRPTALREQPFLIIIRRSHASSKDFAAMMRTARAQHENSIKAKQIAGRKPA